MSIADVYFPVLTLSSFVKRYLKLTLVTILIKLQQVFTNITPKIWPLKIVSRDSLFLLTSTDFPIIINDTIYDTKKKKCKMKI